MNSISDNIAILEKHFAKHLLTLRDKYDWKKYHRTKLQTGNDMYGNAVLYCRISYNVKDSYTGYMQHKIKYAHLEVPYSILRMDCLEKVLDCLCYDSNKRKEYSSNDHICTFLLRLQNIGDTVLEGV